MNHIPPLSADLIEEMDQLYPPIKCSEIPKTDQRKLDFKAGQRSVVEFLQQRLKQQEEE